jgi:hypothetical protein
LHGAPVRGLISRLTETLAESIAERVISRLHERGHPESVAAGSPAPSATVNDGAQHIALDYPVTPRPRWGQLSALPEHPQLTRIIRAADATVQESIATIARHKERLRQIAAQCDNELDPHWINGWLPGWDGAALYAFVADRHPGVYLEVGSGNSTKFVRRAINDLELSTRIVSIDPHPRAEVDQLCDTVIRKPLENTDLGLLDSLQPGDIVFIDNSHRAFQNSDVTVALLEVLPRLCPGVLVGIHDIFLPDDYPIEWADRYYSEQYLLAAYLLGGHAGTEIVLPAFDASRRPEMAAAINAVWDTPGLESVERHGGAFWMQTT